MKQLLLLILTTLTIFSAKAQTILSDSVTIFTESLYLKGTLSYPQSKKKLPVVIIISGTGQQDRDGSFANHKPFAEIAQHLNKNGFAVLRMDDRGVGQSEGIYEDATTQDFANDVKAEIDWLKKHPAIHKKKIGLIGHSEGGAVAFMLAATSPDVKYMISLAGLAVDGYSSLVLQNHALLEKNKYINAEQVELYMSLYIPLFKGIKNTPLSESIEPVIDTLVSQWKTQHTYEQLKAIQMADGRDLNFLYRYKKLASRNWYRQMIQYNPNVYLSKITIPVLALNGDKDIMVTPTENLNNIEQQLTKAGNKHFKTVLLANHNHMFQHCNECTQEEMRNLPEAISQETLDIMVDWLHKEVK